MKGLLLEEIDGRFGDDVIVHFTDVTVKQVENPEVNDDEKYSIPIHKE